MHLYSVDYLSLICSVREENNVRPVVYVDISSPNISNKPGVSNWEDVLRVRIRLGPHCIRTTVSVSGTSPDSRLQTVDTLFLDYVNNIERSLEFHRAYLYVFIKSPQKCTSCIGEIFFVILKYLMIFV